MVVNVRERGENCPLPHNTTQYIQLLPKAIAAAQKDGWWFLHCEMSVQTGFAHRETRVLKTFKIS